MLRSRAISLALFLALRVSVCSPTAAAGQTVPRDAGCMEQKGVYHCNWSSFKLIFDRARTVAVEVSPRDKATANQLAALSRELGKTAVAPDQPSDLNLVVLPVDPGGVNLGPGDHDLATLRIYATEASTTSGEGSSRGVLLWAEVLRGQGDRPWPAEVHALLAQFQERFGNR